MLVEVPRWTNEKIEGSLRRHKKETENLTARLII